MRKSLESHLLESGDARETINKLLSALAPTIWNQLLYSCKQYKRNVAFLIS